MSKVLKMMSGMSGMQVKVLSESSDIEALRAAAKAAFLEKENFGPEVEGEPEEVTMEREAIFNRANQAYTALRSSLLASGASEASTMKQLGNFAVQSAASAKQAEKLPSLYKAGTSLIQAAAARGDVGQEIGGTGAPLTATQRQLVAIKNKIKELKDKVKFTTLSALNHSLDEFAKVENELDEKVKSIISEKEVKGTISSKTETALTKLYVKINAAQIKSAPYKELKAALDSERSLISAAGAMAGEDQESADKRLDSLARTAKGQHGAVRNITDKKMLEVVSLVTKQKPEPNQATTLTFSELLDEAAHSTDNTYIDLKTTIKEINRIVHLFLLKLKKHSKKTDPINTSKPLGSIVSQIVDPKNDLRKGRTELSPDLIKIFWLFLTDSSVFEAAKTKPEFINSIKALERASKKGSITNPIENISSQDGVFASAEVQALFTEIKNAPNTEAIQPELSEFVKSIIDLPAELYTGSLTTTQQNIADSIYYAIINTFGQPSDQVKLLKSTKNTHAQFLSDEARKAIAANLKSYRLYFAGNKPAASRGRQTGKRSKSDKEHILLKPGRSTFVSAYETLKGRSSAEAEEDYLQIQADALISEYKSAGCDFSINLKPGAITDTPETAASKSKASIALDKLRKQQAEDTDFSPEKVAYYEKMRQDIKNAFASTELPGEKTGVEQDTHLETLIGTTDLVELLKTELSKSTDVSVEDIISPIAVHFTAVIAQAKLEIQARQAEIEKEAAEDLRIAKTSTTLDTDAEQRIGTAKKEAIAANNLLVTKVASGLRNAFDQILTSLRTLTPKDLKVLSSVFQAGYTPIDMDDNSIVSASSEEGTTINSFLTNLVETISSNIPADVENPTEEELAKIASTFNISAEGYDYSDSTELQALQSELTTLDAQIAENPSEELTATRESLLSEIEAAEKASEAASSEREEFKSYNPKEPSAESASLEDSYNEKERNLDLAKKAVKTIRAMTSNAAAAGSAKSEVEALTSELETIDAQIADFKAQAKTDPAAAGDLEDRVQAREPLVQELEAAKKLADAEDAVETAQSEFDAARDALHGDSDFKYRNKKFSDETVRGRSIELAGTKKANEDTLAIIRSLIDTKGSIERVIKNSVEHIDVYDVYELLEDSVFSVPEIDTLLQSGSSENSASIENVMPLLNTLLDAVKRDELEAARLTAIRTSLKALNNHLKLADTSTAGKLALNNLTQPFRTELEEASEFSEFAMSRKDKKARIRAGQRVTAKTKKLKAALNLGEENQALYDEKSNLDVQISAKKIAADKEKADRERKIEALETFKANLSDLIARKQKAGFKVETEQARLDSTSAQILELSTATGSAQDELDTLIARVNEITAKINSGRQVNSKADIKEVLSSQLVVPGSSFSSDGVRMAHPSAISKRMLLNLSRIEISAKGFYAKIVSAVEDLGLVGKVTKGETIDVADPAFFDTLLSLIKYFKEYLSTDMAATETETELFLADEVENNRLSLKAQLRGDGNIGLDKANRSVISYEDRAKALRASQEFTMLETMLKEASADRTIAWKTVVQTAPVIGMGGKALHLTSATLINMLSGLRNFESINVFDLSLNKGNVDILSKLLNTNNYPRLFAARLDTALIMKLYFLQNINNILKSVNVPDQFTKDFIAVTIDENSIGSDKVTENINKNLKSLNELFENSILRDFKDDFADGGTVDTELKAGLDKLSYIIDNRGGSAYTVTGLTGEAELTPVPDNMSIEEFVDAYGTKMVGSFTTALANNKALSPATSKLLGYLNTTDKASTRLGVEALNNCISIIKQGIIFHSGYYAYEAMLKIKNFDPITKVINSPEVHSALQIFSEAPEFSGFVNKFVTIEEVDEMGEKTGGATTTTVGQFSKQGFKNLKNGYLSAFLQDFTWEGILEEIVDLDVEEIKDAQDRPTDFQKEANVAFSRPVYISGIWKSEPTKVQLEIILASINAINKKLESPDLEPDYRASLEENLEELMGIYNENFAALGSEAAEEHGKKITQKNTDLVKRLETTGVLDKPFAAATYAKGLGGLYAMKLNGKSKKRSVNITQDLVSGIKFGLRKGEKKDGNRSEAGKRVEISVGQIGSILKAFSESLYNTAPILANVYSNDKNDLSKDILDHARSIKSSVNYVSLALSTLVSDIQNSDVQDAVVHYLQRITSTKETPNLDLFTSTSKAVTQAKKLFAENGPCEELFDFAEKVARDFIVRDINMDDVINAINKAMTAGLENPEVFNGAENIEKVVAKEKEPTASVMASLKAIEGIKNSFFTADLTEKAARKLLQKAKESLPAAKKAGADALESQLAAIDTAIAAIDESIAKLEATKDKPKATVKAYMDTQAVKLAATKSAAEPAVPEQNENLPIDSRTGLPTTTGYIKPGFITSANPFQFELDVEPSDVVSAKQQLSKIFYNQQAKRDEKKKLEARKVALTSAKAEGKEEKEPIVVFLAGLRQAANSILEDYMYALRMQDASTDASDVKLQNKAALYTKTIATVKTRLSYVIDFIKPIQKDTTVKEKDGTILTNSDITDLLNSFEGLYAILEKASPSTKSLVKESVVCIFNRLLMEAAEEQAEAMAETPEVPAETPSLNVHMQGQKYRKDLVELNAKIRVAKNNNEGAEVLDALELEKEALEDKLDNLRAEISFDTYDIDKQPHILGAAKYLAITLGHTQVSDYDIDLSNGKSPIPIPANGIEASIEAAVILELCSPGSVFSDARIAMNKGFSLGMIVEMDEAGNRSAILVPITDFYSIKKAVDLDIEYITEHFIDK